MNPHPHQGFRAWTRESDRRAHRLQQRSLPPFAIELGVTVTAEPSAGSRDRCARTAGRRSVPPRRRRRARLRRTRAPGLLARHRERPAPGHGAGLVGSALRRAALALCAQRGASRRRPSSWPGSARASRTSTPAPQTGLLDQLASLLGAGGSRALRLDMRELEAEPVQLDLGGHVLAVLDSGAPQSTPPRATTSAARSAARAPSCSGWSRCATPTTPLGALPDPLGRRVRHVLSENARVDAAVAALRRRATSTALGELLDASHRSLRDDYEVSVPAVERAVGRCHDAGALGARIMGGGFGGSVLALFPPEAARLLRARCRGAVRARLRTHGSSGTTTTRGPATGQQEHPHRADRGRGRASSCSRSPG